MNTFFSSSNSTTAQGVLITEDFNPFFIYYGKISMPKARTDVHRDRISTELIAKHFCALSKETVRLKNETRYYRIRDGSNLRSLISKNKGGKK